MWRHESVNRMAELCFRNYKKASSANSKPATLGNTNHHYSCAELHVFNASRRICEQDGVGGKSKDGKKTNEMG